MPCKPGVAGSIPGFSIPDFSIKPLSVSLWVFPLYKPTQILNHPGGTGLYLGKPQKVCYCIDMISVMSASRDIIDNTS